MTASATTTGVVNRAVAFSLVVSSATTMIVASPTGSTSGSDSRCPLSVSTSSPQPSDSSASTSGNATQQSSCVIA